MPKMSRKTVVLGGAAAIFTAAAVGGAAAAAGSGPGDDDLPGLTGSDLQRATDAALDSAGGGRITDVEADDDTRTYEVEVTRDDGSEVDVRLDSDLAVVSSVAEEPEPEQEPDPDPDDRPVTDDELARASDAALAAAGDGRVTETDRDDDGTQYDVEVTHPDGSESDVELDGNFAVVEVSRDGPGGD